MRLAPLLLGLAPLLYLANTGSIIEKFIVSVRLIQFLLIWFSYFDLFSVHFNLIQFILKNKHRVTFFILQQTPPSGVSLCNIFGTLPNYLCYVAMCVFIINVEICSCDLCDWLYPTQSYLYFDLSVLWNSTFAITCYLRRSSLSLLLYSL